MKSRAILLSLLCLLAAVATWLTFVPSAEEVAKYAAEKADNELRKQAKADPRLAPVFAEYPRLIPLSVLQSLRAEDESILIAAYQHTPNLIERRSLTWTLGYIGSDRAVEVLKHALTDEFKGRMLTGGNGTETTDEAHIMCETVQALGLAAMKNEAAFNFVKQGTDPWFWKRTIGWTSSNKADDYGMLASDAIVATAQSGRKEVPTILEELSKQPLMNTTDPRPYRRNLSGAVVDAAFFYAVIRDQGREAYMGMFLTSEGEGIYDDGNRYAKWSATPEGQKWGEWYQDHHKSATAQRLKELERKP